MGSPKRAAVLINTGSPKSPEPQAVADYLAGFLMDRYIRPLPPFLWYFILHHAIIPRRKCTTAEKYQIVWTEQGSPLVDHCNNLASRVEQELQAEYNHNITVCAAMLFGTQTLGEVFSKLMEQGVEELVCIPLFPQQARCTTESVRHAVGKALRRLSWKPKTHFITHYAGHPLYLNALENSIKESGFRPNLDHLVISFHSVPQRDIKRGDQYCAQVHATADELIYRLGLGEDHVSLCFQSPFEDNRRWIEPSTLTELKRKASFMASRPESERLFLICPGFAVDCLETRFDVFYDLMPCFEEVCKTHGGPEREFHYIECLNDKPDHVALFAQLIRDIFVQH